MATYTPENNPYIPGDPACYDLKWIVEQLKKSDTFKVEEAVADAQAAAAESAGSATEAAGSATEAAASATAAAASAADTTQAQAAAASAQQAAISAQQAAASAADTTQAQAAKGWSDQSEAWAVGTKNGTAVPSTAEQYQNNAKYYAGIASQISSPVCKLANGSITSDYALLVVWFEDQAISNQQYSAVIPNDTTQTFDVSYTAWNSSFMYSMCALCQISSGTLSFTSLKSNSPTNNNVTTWSTLPTIRKIWGIKGQLDLD